MALNWLDCLPGGKRERSPGRLRVGVACGPGWTANDNQTTRTKSAQLTQGFHCSIRDMAFLLAVHWPVILIT